MAVDGGGDGEVGADGDPRVAATWKLQTVLKLPAPVKLSLLPLRVPLKYWPAGVLGSPPLDES